MLFALLCVFGMHHGTVKSTQRSLSLSEQRDIKIKQDERTYTNNLLSLDMSPVLEEDRKRDYMNMLGNPRPEFLNKDPGWIVNAFYYGSQFAQSLLQQFRGSDFTKSEEHYKIHHFIGAYTLTSILRLGGMFTQDGIYYKLMSLIFVNVINGSNYRKIPNLLLDFMYKFFINRPHKGIDQVNVVNEVVNQYCETMTQWESDDLNEYNNDLKKVDNDTTRDYFRKNRVKSWLPSEVLGIMLLMDQ
eukprot:NODE_182_length_13754_cov_0.678067.p8 type:complete len:244 gc:universal NODE_182_length_13754_cov_0.678067:6445-5714(-)